MRTAKIKSFPLIAAPCKGEVGSQLETVRTVRCVFAYMKCLLLST